MMSLIHGQFLCVKKDILFIVSYLFFSQIACRVISPYIIVNRLCANTEVPIADIEPFAPRAPVSVFLYQGLAVLETSHKLIACISPYLAELPLFHVAERVMP